MQLLLQLAGPEGGELERPLFCKKKNNRKIFNY